MIIGHLLSTVSYLTIYVGQLCGRNYFITYENLMTLGQWIEHDKIHTPSYPWDHMEDRATRQSS